VVKRRDAGAEDYDKVIESLFATPRSGKNKTKFDVENYSDVLYPIEFAIASYYVEHSSLTDKKLERTIMSLLERHDKINNSKSNTKKKTVKKYKPSSEKMVIVNIHPLTNFI